MARKLKGKTLSTKGLKGALVRHFHKEQHHQKLTKNAEIQSQNEINKQKSIKSTKKQKQNTLKQTAQQKGLIPFSQDDRVLLIGEGDFSFAKCLISQGFLLPQNLIATSYDSLEVLEAKYPTIQTNLTELAEEGVKIIHEVDATNLITSLKLPSKQRKKSKNLVELFPGGHKLNYVMFNFPHTGRGIKDMDRNIQDQQKLILSFFQNVKELFEVVNSDLKNDFAGYLGSTGESKSGDGKIILSLFEGEPYNSWGVKILGRSEGYKVEKSGRFDWKMFPEYHHRRTNSMQDTSKPAAERDARMYVFEKFEKVENKKQKEDDSDSD
ncbi:uncharacterized protein J8A68_002349 [[Candida] subhashii]|uniref:25S rRNA (uridine-N(3))-methyltransferase BMT5-like domain-containing protein n=1 Tax=[Candida] subhashii TaxID=561895 RepID=A0A8J5QPC8_9ASCO|nr:uncharacterized protein J8A68_002349 [[Candida] subhashii]KAG7664095.1 hypothetical protein J8A68_002349 [[Candida] subhashii]